MVKLATSRTRGGGNKLTGEEKPCLSECKQLTKTNNDQGASAGDIVISQKCFFYSSNIWTPNQITTEEKIYCVTDYHF